ncbi:Acyl-CoA reductase [Sinomicrobium oceani]|uniref:Acyl-CoA reductase n=1 Tax=Sinomicrobium oceani TaxID=1150368 RepID=A0A1K1NEW9_9FLAO|nr:aldehyde dehydrogenase family protein [Sinomicrobium oceani]SFW33809.1 Acyl-CoA reductase [Sinomicrobium oceani]
MKICNPATEAIIAEYQEDTAETLSGKFSALKAGQKAWALRTPGERLECIRKFGDLVRTNKNELAAVLTAETGKPIQQSLNEINGAHNRIEHLSEYAVRVLADEVMTDTGNTHEKITYEPLGVIANISAWNFPYNVGYNVFLYALVAGNAVMYKPSEYAAMTGKQFEKYMHLSGVPRDVFQCVIGDGKLGQSMLELNFDGYFFTGSYKTGVHIAETVARKLVPLQLELGGKDPLYIADDVADVKQAAIHAAEGAFYNNGQSCCAVERIYVAESIYNEFVEAFVQEVGTYTMGDPASPDTFIGPVTREAQLEVLAKQVEDAVHKGATLRTGGERVPGKGYYIEPAVLINCNHEMDIMKEESFGPVIGIQKVSSDEEAVRLMQDTGYGLTAAVFCADEQRAKAILDVMDTGTVYWNCCDRVSPYVPWSGRRNSGLGATLSVQGIRAFTRPKAYHWRKPS